MSQPPKPKIKLIIKRSNNGALNALSYPTPDSSPPAPSELKLPLKPTLQQAQELLKRFGRDPTPLIHDSKKQEVIPGPARMTVVKSRGKNGKSVTSLGPYAIGRRQADQRRDFYDEHHRLIGRSMSEQVVLKRLRANREAARVAASGEEIAQQDAFAIREQVLLKEFELCMAMAVVGDVAQPEMSSTGARISSTPVDTPRRKTPKRKAAAVASPRTTRSSAKRRKI